jgi:hypothetical protein
MSSAGIFACVCNGISSSPTFSFERVTAFEDITFSASVMGGSFGFDALGDLASERELGAVDCGLFAFVVLLVFFRT